jgi:hypothetical protein
MATEAQVSANRANARKSTGPRTPEGKAVAAQNAIKHGLLAREAVVRGEDPGQFELYRQQMLAGLAPAEPAEALLAERIAGLAWRLRRAERVQGASFDVLAEKQDKPKPVWSDEAKGWIFPRPAPPGEGEEILALARLVVQDFGQGRILEHLLGYERRIEHSLYRTMAELRNLRKERREQEHKEAKSQGQGFQPSALGVLPSLSAPSLPEEVRANPPETDAQLCETNPIRSEPDRRQVPCGTGVTSDSAPVGPRKTNPICDPTKPEAAKVVRSVPVRAYCGMGVPLINEKDSHLPTESAPTEVESVAGTHGRDGRATGGRDTHAARPSGGGTTNPARGQLCETNPISAGIGVQGPEIGDPTPDTRPLTPALLCETNPIAAGVGKGRVGYTPTFRRRG